MSILYVTGDATAPNGAGTKVIAHICNDEGGWGKGFVVPLAQRYPGAEQAYRDWYKHGRYDGTVFRLGRTQFVQVQAPNLLGSDEIVVANMIAQHGFRKKYDDPPLRYVDYNALERCLESVAVYAKTRNASVHMPRIGTNLGGGTWEEIRPIISGTLSAMGILVTVYDLEK